jgi:hypothetical protein
MSFEEPPWLWSESTWPLSSAFLHHVLLVDLTFKQSVGRSVPAARFAGIYPAHCSHIVLVPEPNFAENGMRRFTY